jgi:hypothetical protein
LIFVSIISLPITLYVPTKTLKKESHKTISKPVYCIVSIISNNSRTSILCTWFRLMALFKTNIQ